VRRPFVLTVDVEPQGRELGSIGEREWPGFLATVGVLEGARRRLRERTRRAPQFSWFVRADPQIERTHGAAEWAFLRYEPELRRLAAEGDAVGLHVHAFRWSDDHASWITDFANAPWVARCVSVGWRAFRAAWRGNPDAFRFGDRWLSNAVVHQLERLGCTVDVTIEAGMPPMERMVATERSSGGVQDYRTVPRHPYRPSRADFRRPGGWLPRRLWHLPVSSGCVNLKPVIPLLVEDRHDMVHLNLGLDPGWICGILDAAFEAGGCVVSVARTGDLADERAADHFRTNLHHLVEHPALAECELMRPDRAVAAASSRGAPGH
jgi:hypothetical protein